MSSNSTTTRNTRKNPAPKKATDLEIGRSQVDTLTRLNMLTAQVKMGNDVVWLDGTRFPEMAFRTKAAMMAIYEGDMVLDNNGEPMNCFKWWLGRADRRKIEEVVFDPARYFADGNTPFHSGPADRPSLTALNLFTGWAKKPNPHGSCEMFYEHLRENYTGGDPATLKVVLDWMAHLFQRPGKPIGWALAVVGDNGSGKGVVADVLMEIMGRKYSPLFTKPDQLLGKFNSALAKCLLARMDEAINPRDPSQLATLKSYLTGGDVMLEQKGIDAIAIQNRANFIFLSNNSHFLAAGTQGERRYFAFRCGNGRQQDGAYFAKLKRQMEAGGYSKLLHDLMDRDISAVDFTSPPRTAVLSQQIRAGLGGLDRWWADCLEAGELVFARAPDTAEPLSWADWAEDRQGGFAPLKEDVMASASAYARDYNGRPPSPAQVGKFLAEHANASAYRARGEMGVREQRYQLPSLDECRARFIESRPGLRLEDVGGAASFDAATAANLKPESTTAKVFTMARPAVRAA